MSSTPGTVRFAELRCKTNYSFLTGASHPEELIAQAAELGLSALAITDRDGVYGIPKAFAEAKKHAGLKLITGAELTLHARAGIQKQKDQVSPALRTSGPRHVQQNAQTDSAQNRRSEIKLPPLTLLARDRAAYGVLCRILTAAHAGRPKGEPSLDWATFLALMERPGATGLIAIPVLPLSSKERELDYQQLREVFGAERLLIPLSRFLDGHDGRRTEKALQLAKQFGVKIVATNDVHYHTASRRRMQDVETSIRHGKTLAASGRGLFSNAERHLKSPEQMLELFHDMPEAVSNAVAVADSCTFSPSELRYYYPSEWIPSGHTAQTFLEELVWKGCETRYPREQFKDGTPPAVTKQLRHELKLIHELGFADYFLTIWEVVTFARERKILCQGRGSAANSAVCYVLGITAVDPVRMNLLFERFISAERGEPPDIDVDFEHERREEVIQHLYEKYGRDRAAMVSAVITYRSRSARREVKKALGLDPDAEPADPLANAKVEALAEEIEGFPRHLSIHSGGFTLSRDPIIETVPVEPARMDGRTIIQWDKYDLDIVGLLKIDILALGMLSAIRKTCDMTGWELATIPGDDADTWDMMKRADTVGVFQIESRAQMNMLGRLQPENFYDLVIEVAIMRPGPIVGKMVHPYLKRRRGEEPVEMPHPKLIPILGKTLGVPLFQEQVMKMAMALAGFTPGEADELRRAIGAWRSSGAIEKMGRKLQQGLLASGLPMKFVDNVFEQIKGFAHYGFPESHAASFALLAYASSYLKCHHPAEFACALVNSQPMGFYSVHSIIDDAKRHGVRVLPVHPNFSDWDCSITSDGALQLGWRVVKGLGEADAGAIVAARNEKPFRDLPDFCSRVRLSPNLIHRMALGDAFKLFGCSQRDALWEILACQMLLEPDPDTGQLNLFTGAALVGSSRSRSLFRPLDELEAIKADYSAFSLSTRGHPMQALRQKMRRLPSATTATGRALGHGMALSIAGLVIVRQRPPTAKGTVFATLEDEQGFLDLTLRAEIHARYEDVFAAHAFLAVEGVIQRDRNSMSLLVRRMRPLWPDSVAPHTVSIAPMGSPAVQKSGEASRELSALTHAETRAALYPDI